MRHLALLPTLIFAAACGQADSEPALGELGQAIVNGEASTPSDDATVYVYAKTTTSKCSGTLIAPNLVATALHCVTSADVGVFTCRPDGTVDGVNPSDGHMGTLLDADQIEVRVGADPRGSAPSAVGKQLLSTGSTQICRGDIAFVVLDRAVDAPIAPVRLTYGVKGTERLRLLGYGATETHTDSVRLVRTGVRIIDIGPETEDEASISASPRTFVVNEGPCQGDSGGPAFSEETGALVGVYSLAAGESCTGVGVRNVYTSLPSFSSLALDAFEAAGAEPVLDEADPEPEAPDVVAESGCTIAAASRSREAPGLGLFALAALGLGLAFRRRRG